MTTTHERVPILSISDLSVDYETDYGPFSALRGITLDVAPGEILGLVGESGCGKSTLGRSLLRLNDEASTRYQGSIHLDGTEVLSLKDTSLPSLRGSEIAMIFQDPLRSLNPVFTIGTQLKNAISLGGITDKRKVHAESISLLERVGLDDPERRLRQYPHQLSGGQRQRVVIAIALAQSPKVLVADEPTTALDVTTQKQILKLLRQLCTDTGMALIFVTHDLAVVWQLCDRVAVMYFGIVIEHGAVEDIFDAPVHPYTGGLLAAVPSLETEKGRPLATIERRHDGGQGGGGWDDDSAEFDAVSPNHFVRKAQTSRVDVERSSNDC
ncbi:ABC transporter ATP-binding protein [Brevibacterium sp. RIT 803]|uniref:ABC transporter ATP-binding protein n=1 Tax=Brevibacterium sp. RIT 803 TaxID=2810210 RepID=UPI00194E2363|nr:ABC transporter ATP-binding protein [Brevibacterium sp. RIT 803]MBM6588895.1 ABC transporter ATP-binding protein [Brevibacterium sp. RIT 803]